MAITIGAARMVAGTGGHTATLGARVAADGTRDAWVVSWCPGRLLARAQAITALRLAEAVAGGAGPDDPRVRGWAGELHMDPATAVRQITGR